MAKRFNIAKALKKGKKKKAPKFSKSVFLEQGRKIASARALAKKAFCLNCKKKVSPNGSKITMAKNNRKMQTGTCPTCKGKTSVFV